MRAFIFPGQGSQAIGMGKALHDAFAEAKEVFQEVDSALGQNLSKLMFEGDLNELTLTQNAQPALMACSIATLRVLLKQSGKKLPELANYVAGHSLGEYTALCAAESISLYDTSRLLRIRGNAMQSATPVGQGGMAAIIGVNIEIAERIVAAASEGEDACQVANDNADGQVVISGAIGAIQRAEAVAKSEGAKRYMPLNVSAPFHSHFMKPAASIMREALDNAEVKAPIVPVLANVSVEALTKPQDIRTALVEQVTGRVRWRESIQWLAAKGVTQTVEIGSGKVLSGLTKRIADGVEAISIGTPEEVETFIKGF